MDKLTKEEKEEGVVIVKCTNCDVSLMSHRDLMNLSICIQCKSRNTLYVEDDNVKSPEHNSGNAEKKVEAKVNYNTTGVERRSRIMVNKTFGDGFYKSMSANDDADAKKEQIELKGSGCMLVLIIGFLITVIL